MTIEHDSLRRLNKFDYIIIITIASLAYGNFEILGAITPIRVIGILSIPMLITYYRTLYNSSFRPWLFFLAFWWTYMMLSLIWTPDKNLALIYFIHMTTMFLSMLLLCLCSLKATSPISSISNGWTLMCLITLPIAIWEITTGNHLLSGSYNVDSVMDNSYRQFAAVTFMNLNSYVLMICIALPFIFIGLIGEIKQFRLLKLLTLFPVLFILLVNASRAGFICLLLSLAIFFIVKFKQYNIVAKIILVLSVLLISSYIISNLSTIEAFHQILYRLDGKTSIMEDDGRTQLIETGIVAASRTCFFGGGIMSMITLYKQAQVTRIHYAHNFPVEILVEYGLVICILLFTMLYNSIFKLRKSKLLSMRYLFYYAAVASVFIFVIDDYYQTRSGVWMYLISIIILSTKYREQPNLKP